MAIQFDTYLRLRCPTISTWCPKTRVDATHGLDASSCNHVAWLFMVSRMQSGFVLADTTPLHRVSEREREWENSMPWTQCVPKPSLGPSHRDNTQRIRAPAHCRKRGKPSRACTRALLSHLSTSVTPSWSHVVLMCWLRHHRGGGFGRAKRLSSRSVFVFGAEGEGGQKKKQTSSFFRKLEEAVTASGVCAGVLEENGGKVPGKLPETFPELPNATNSRISGTRKGKPAGNLG